MGAERRLTVHNPLNDEGLSVVDATSPVFMDEVKRMLTPEAFSKAALFLPLSLVIKNNTGRYIWGFAVIYTLPDRISASGKPWQFQFSHSAPAPDRRLMLGPDESFLITPVSSFDASIDATGNRTRQPLLDEGLDRVIEVFTSQYLNDRIEASADSVIYEDGTLSGPDSMNRLEEVNARLKANSDLVASVSDLRGEPLRKELQLLRGLSQRNDAYSTHLRDTATALLSMLDAPGGEGSVLESVARMGSAKWFGNSQTVRRKQQ